MKFAKMLTGTKGTATRIVAILLVLMMLAVTGCSNGEPETSGNDQAADTGDAQDAVVEDKVLRVGENFFFKSGFALETDDAYALSRLGVGETLTKVDSDGKLMPGLAKSWSQTDELTWVFKLESGIKFTNGEEFNADAVVKALDNLLNVTAPARTFSAKFVESVSSDGVDTVIIKTLKPDVILPARMASPTTLILAPAAYKEDGSIDPFNTGTGPFIMTEFVPDQKAVAVKNENYWNGTVTLDGAEFIWVPDVGIRAGMIESGELDIVRNVPLSEVSSLEENENLIVYQTPGPRAMNIYMNNESGPLSDVKVRQAIAHSVDKALINEAIMEGCGNPLITSFNESEEWFNSDIEDYEYDVDKAIALLAEAGYTKDDPLTLRLWTYPSRTELPSTALALQGMMAKANIVTEIRVAPYGVLEGDVLSGNFDMFILNRGHLNEGYDPIGFLMADYLSTGGYNLNNVAIPELDDLIMEAAKTADHIERFEIYKEIQQVIHDNVVEVNLAQVNSIEVTINNIKNYTPDPLDWTVMTADLDIE